MKKTILSVAVATTLGLAMGAAQADMGIPSPDPISPITPPDAVVPSPEPTKPQTGADFMDAFNKRFSEFGYEIVINDKNYVQLVDKDGNTHALAQIQPKSGKWKQNDKQKENAIILKSDVRRAITAYMEHNNGDVVLPTPKTPDQIKDMAKSKVLVWKGDLTNKQKGGLIENVAANKDIVVKFNDATTDGMATMEFSLPDGSTYEVTAAEFNSWMLTKQEARADERNNQIGIPTPPVEDMPIIEPIDSREKAKQHATEVAKEWQAGLTDGQKATIVADRADAAGFTFDAYENANGETVLTFTNQETGEAQGATVEQFKRWAINKQVERKTERDLNRAPVIVPPVEDAPIIEPDVEKFKAAINNLQESGENLKTDLTAGKRELEVAAQSATEQMVAQFAAMQKQLDEQAKLIAELQNGENPSVPSTGISPEAESALRDASATLQAKMDVAVNKLQGAANTLQEKGSKLAPQDPDFGINPPSQGVPTHELGSIGEGQAVAYVQNGLEELYNTGNEQAQQYADKALSDAKSYTDTQIAGINSRIDGIEEDLETVMATSQAVTAARPYLSSNQTNAIGVGLGNSGSQNAIAVGYAHRINENWTANANLSGTSGNEVDYSVGAGLSYAW
ncbi:YadA-like family protein [Vibrio sp. DNB22_17_1]